MPTASRDFFTGTVRPTADEFLADTTNIRRGRLAAIVLYHMADYWALETGEKPHIISEELIKDCPDFLLIRDVANASKHNILIRDDKRLTAKALKDSSQIVAPAGLFSAPFGEGVFREAAVVEICLDNGSHRQLVEVIRNVLTKWESMLAP